MQDRERILELVKKGVLSTEEALVLLESMAQEKDAQQLAKAAEEVSTEKDATKYTEKVAEEDVTAAKEAEAATKAAKDAEKAEAKARLEAELAELAEKANQASASLDEVNEKLAQVQADLKAKAEAKQVYDTMEELGTLTESKEAELKEVVQAIEDLQLEEDKLLGEQKELEQELKAINKQRFQNTKEKVTQKFEIPDDWKNQAQDTFEKASDKVTEAGNQFGSFLKKTLSSIAVAVNDNVDWKDVNIKVPGMASTKFQHTFNYPEVAASLIDVKLANGSVTFKESNTQDLKVEANIKLYGKMDSETPLAAFLEKSQIDVDDEMISFQIPNKRVKADLVFYLPMRTYDHVSIKLLNGDVDIETLTAKDVYAKSTNGDVTFDNINASMLEVHGVNGDIEVAGGTLLDLSVESVNGDITFKQTAIASVNASLVNGDIRGTLIDNGLKSLQASSVNGDVKLALPVSLGLEGKVSTSLGKVHNRLSDLEIIRERNGGVNSKGENFGGGKLSSYLEFRRVAAENIATVQANTTTGAIYLKDTDQQ